MIQEVSILAAFGAGVATFLAPCTFVTLPVFITYIVGATAEEIAKGGKKARVKAILNTVFYTLGFTLVFVLLGMTATTLGSLFQENKEVLMKIGGAFVVLFGIFMLFGDKIGFLKFLYKERKGRISAKFEGYQYFRAFLIGITSAFAWTPCIGPILGSILVYAGSTTSAAWQGGFLLFIYSLGITLPFYLFAYLIGIGSKLTKKLNGYISLIYKVFAVLLIILGLMLILGLSAQIFVPIYELFVKLGYRPA